MTSKWTDCIWVGQVDIDEEELVDTLGNVVHIVTRIEKRFRSDFKTIAKRFQILDHMVKC